MLRYILQRLLTAIPTFFVIVTLSFLLMRVAPGGPFNQERGLNPIIKANLEKLYHLDQSLWQQYINFWQGLLHGDFGPSYNLPDFTVAEILSNGLYVCITLGVLALTFALLLGGLLGITAALNQNRAADFLVVAMATAGSTIPTFVVAPLFQLFFALALKWFPVGGWTGGGWKVMVGPVAVLMLPQLATVARLMRGSLSHGCAMIEGETKGRSLWADAWVRLRANKAASFSIIYLILMTPFCIAGPWFVQLDFDTIFENYNRVPPSLSAYPKSDTIEAMLQEASKRAKVDFAGFEEKNGKIYVTLTASTPIEERVIRYFDRSGSFEATQLEEKSADGLTLIISTNAKKD